MTRRNKKDSHDLCIGINALFQARGGSLTNLTMLVEEWTDMGLFSTNRFIFFCGSHTASILRPKLLDNAELVVMKTADKNLITRVIVEQVFLPVVMRKYRLDVLFCPANTIPIATSIPTVTTFQNAAPFCDVIKPCDVGFRTYVRLCIVGLFMRIAAIRSKKIIYISKYFMDLCSNRYNISDKKGVVIYRARDNV